MSISTPALATTTAVTALPAPRETPAAVTGRAPRYPQIPARAGNANVRALLAQGIHPASGQPLTTTPGADCGSCALAYLIQLPGRDGDQGEDGAGQRLKCSKAPISRRGRQGIDLRPAHGDQPATPACTLHCTFSDWPYDPDGRYDTGAGQIGTGRDHADDWGVYAVYRIFGVDLEHPRVWVELEAEMVPDTAAPGGFIARPPHLYRFWTDLARLHTADLIHPSGTGDCTHALVRGGRVLLSQSDA